MKLSTLHNESLFYMDSRVCRTLHWTKMLAFWVVSGFWLNPWLVTCVQETNNWLHCSPLQKHVVNRNIWRSPKRKHEYTLEHLPNLFRQYDSITVSTEGALALLNQYFHLPLCSVYYSWLSGSGSMSWFDWVEAGTNLQIHGLRILNEARCSYIQAILRQEEISFTRGKTFKYVILIIKDELLDKVIDRRGTLKK